MGNDPELDKPNSEEIKHKFDDVLKDKAAFDERVLEIGAKEDLNYVMVLIECDNFIECNEKYGNDFVISQLYFVKQELYRICH